jgi:hypothetical protein
MAAELNNSVLILDGDAESRLLIDAEIAMQAIFADQEMRVARAWSTRPDWLDARAPELPRGLVSSGAFPGTDARTLLGERHRLVIFSTLPAVAFPTLRHRDGGAFIAPRGLRATWSADVAARVAAECTEEPPMAPADAAAALELLIERLQARGAAVVLCTTFRHVRQSPELAGREAIAALREAIRRMNLEVARLSLRTGCYVLDLDRPLAHEGGAVLDADCFGGGGRAAELALDEFAAVMLDAIPDAVVPQELS